ncbi:glycoside hydrolase family 16 protein [Mycena olivaceomarginata]|nr:glycoside hydrolase family 16 protein [Mycena olivaceomarginata]
MSTGFRREYRTGSSPNLLVGSESQDWESLPPSPRSGLAEKYSLAPDPALWGSNIYPNMTEPDDDLHNPDSKDRSSFSLSTRGIYNIGCLVVLCLAIMTLFVGYPVLTFVKKTFSTATIFGGNVNSTGQVPSIGNFGLIDLDTPSDAYTITSLYSGKEMKLVFSDEFNTDGRTFYPGDDPYWEAEDLHYWQTNNMENGSLRITLSAKQTHGLDYQGGKNKFCFTGGLLVTSAILPGTNNIHGLWPAFWSMGNLGRAGYGASLDGMWPYTYDACDVGTTPNQTLNGLPTIATTSGDTNAPYNGELSYLPGQRLSRCTCAGESHPGPVHASDGSYVGRSAPEIDVFGLSVFYSECFLFCVLLLISCQPFNAAYVWFNTSDNLIIPDPTASVLNTYTGGAFQQATSVVTQTNQECYELLGACYSVYGFEVRRFDGAYISWITDDKLAWTIKSAGMAADTQTEISARPVPQEPMYILANLGMSTNFGTVDLDHLTFPTTLSLDYVRVYQYAGRDPNLTTWVDDYKQTIPKNKFMGQC